jgi:hypothetical protein
MATKVVVGQLSIVEIELDRMALAQIISHLNIHEMYRVAESA